MTQYTYTISDGSSCRKGATFEAESVEDAVAQVAEFLKTAASEFPVWDYPPGHVIHAIIWREDGAVIGSLTHELDADKNNVRQWETVATYVDTFSDDSELGEGAVDVEVQVGHCGSAWFVRTRDDMGDIDDAPNDVYDSREAAVAAAKEFAAWHNVAEEGEDAEGYLWRRRAEKAEAENE